MSVDGNSIIIQEEEEDGQVREQLMEDLKSIYKNGRRVKRRNEALKRCLREFFKKRKLDHMCKEQELSSAEIEAAYESKLDNYARVCAANEAQLRVKCEEQTRLDEACERMQLVWTQRLEMLKQAELQTGGRWLDEMKKDKRDGLMKRLTKLIETQSECYSTEGKTRLDEIKLREKIRASEAELKLVDNVDGDIQACDYERVHAESERIQTNIDEKCHSSIDKPFTSAIDTPVSPPTSLIILNSTSIRD